MSAADRTKDKPDRLADFVDGVRRGIPVGLAALPFGMLFGTVGVQNGMSVAEATLMSAMLFAGASQLVGIEMFGQKIAPWMVVLSIFAVNFRHILYSAAIGRQMGHWSRLQRVVGFFFLTDGQYADGERKALEGPLPFSWYMGYGLLLYSTWVLGTAVGAAFGNLIPNAYALGLDFLLVIYFMGMVMGFRKRPLWLPVVGVSAAASIAAHHVIGSPWHVSAGAIAGVALAALLTPGRKGARP